VHTYPLAEYMRHVQADRWDAAGELLLASADTLVRAGAELLEATRDFQARPS